MDDAFRAMLTRTAKAPPAEQAVMLAFTCGYAAHLCLDAQLIPGPLLDGRHQRRHDVGRGRAGHAPPQCARGVHRRHPAAAQELRLRLDPPGTTARHVAGAARRHGVTAVPTLRRSTASRSRRTKVSAALRDMALVYGRMTDPALRPVTTDQGRRACGRSPRPHADADLPPGRSCLSHVPARRAAALEPPVGAGRDRTTTFAEIRETAAAETTRFLEAAQQAVFGDGDVEAGAGRGRRPQHGHGLALRGSQTAGGLRP